MFVYMRECACVCVCISVSVCVNVCELGFLDPGTIRVCVCVSVSGVCQCASKGS